MSFTKNDCGQHHIIKCYNINQRGTDTLHGVIPIKYQNYPSTTILKNAKILAKANKFPYVHLLDMTTHDA